MADTDPSGSDNSFGYLTHKIGPLPVWAYAVIAVGAWYWYTHYGPGASAATATTTATDTTDDNADDDSQDAIAQGVSGSRYSTNAQWEASAINFLVGESVPPDEASAAVFKYLHSQKLTPQEQNDINLAIEGIGPPPKIPAPAEQTPNPKPKPKPIPHPKVPPRKPAPHPKPKPHEPPPRRFPGGEHGGPPVKKPVPLTRHVKTKTTPRRKAA